MGLGITMNRGILINCLCMAAACFSLSVNAETVASTNWIGFDSSLLKRFQAQSDWLIPQNSEEEFGCPEEALPDWRKQELITQRFERTDAFTEWLNQQTKIAGP